MENERKGCGKPDTKFIIDLNGLWKTLWCNPKNFDIIQQFFKHLILLQDSWGIDDGWMILSILPCCKSHSYYYANGMHYGTSKNLAWNFVEMQCHILVVVYFFFLWLSVCSYIYCNGFYLKSRKYKHLNFRFGYFSFFYNSSARCKDTIIAIC